MVFSQIKINLLLLAIPLFLSSLSNASNDSIAAALPVTISFHNQDSAFIQIAELINTGQLDRARRLLDLGKKQTGEDSNFIARYHYYLADYYFYKEYYDSAHQNYEKVLPLFEEQKDTLMMAKTLCSIGLIYSLKHDSEKTLEYLLRETELLNKVKNKTPKLKTEEIILLTNIINVYSVSGEYEKVIETCRQALSLANELNDTLRLASNLNSLALAQKNLGETDQALKTFKKAGQLFLQLHDDLRNAIITNNIGGIYELDDRDLDSALFYYNKSLKMFQDIQYQYGTAMAMIGVASLNARKQNFVVAEKAYREVIGIARHYQFNEALLSAYEGLAQLKYDRQNYKEAYEINILFQELNDSLFNEEKQSRYAELETRYKIIQKENEINLLKNEKLKQQLKLEKANLQRLIGFILVIFLLVIIYVFVIYYNHKKRDNKLLMEKNQQIETQNEKLKQMYEHIQTINKRLQWSKQELSLANKSKDKFFSILAHDLKNPFHTVLGQSFLLSKNYDQLGKEERKNYADEMYTSSEQIERLLDNLLEWSRTQSKGIEFKPQRVQLNELVQNTLTLLKPSAERKSIQLINECNDAIYLHADRQMLETIIRNTINNGIKFTPAGGFVKISAVTSKQKLKLIIEDNGVGMKKETLRGLFKLHANIKTKGTNGERGTGLGLVICKEFVDFHKGKINVESEVGKGSRVIIELPLRTRVKVSSS